MTLPPHCQNTYIHNCRLPCVLSDQKKASCKVRLCLSRIKRKRTKQIQWEWKNALILSVNELHSLKVAALQYTAVQKQHTSYKKICLIVITFLQIQFRKTSPIFIHRPIVLSIAPQFSAGSEHGRCIVVAWGPFCARPKNGNGIVSALCLW